MKKIFIITFFYFSYFSIGQEFSNNLNIHDNLKLNPALCSQSFLRYDDFIPSEHIRQRCYNEDEYFIRGSIENLNTDNITQQYSISGRRRINFRRKKPGFILQYNYLKSSLFEVHRPIVGFSSKFNISPRLNVALGVDLKADWIKLYNSEINVLVPIGINGQEYHSNFILSPGGGFQFNWKRTRYGFQEIRFGGVYRSVMKPAPLGNSRNHEFTGYVGTGHLLRHSFYGQKKRLFYSLIYRETISDGSIAADFNGDPYNSYRSITAVVAYQKGQNKGIYIIYQDYLNQLKTIGLNLQWGVDPIWRRGVLFRIDAAGVYNFLNKGWSANLSLIIYRSKCFKIKQPWPRDSF